MTLFLTLLGYGKSAMSAVLSWLSRRSVAELACIVLFVVAAFLDISLQAEKRHSARLQTQVTKLSAQLKAISTARDNQKAVTAKTVEHVKERVKQADDRAKVVEQAPLNGKCETPKEILQADL
jgi:hypothetical protein